MVKSKICSKCGTNKTLDEFYRRKDTLLGYRAECKACFSIYKKVHYQKNRERIKARSCAYYASNRERERKVRKEYRSRNRQKANERENKRTRQLRNEMLDAYGSICACCGESERLFLELDHVNGDGAKHRAETGCRSSTSMYRWLKKRDWPKKRFQLLCSNCNQGKKRNNGICPHQERKTIK